MCARTHSRPHPGGGNGNSIKGRARSPSRVPPRAGGGTEKNRGAGAPSPRSRTGASSLAEVALVVSSPLVPAGTPPAYLRAVVRAPAEGGGVYGRAVLAEERAR